MKPELEHIDHRESPQSFRFFIRQEAYFTSFWHYHEEIEITFIQQGEGTRFVGDSIRSFTDYDLVLIGRHTPHNWVGSDQAKNQPQRAVVIQFTPDLFNHLKECEGFIDLFEQARRGIYFPKPNHEIIDLLLGFETRDSIGRLTSLLRLLQCLQKASYKEFLASEGYVFRQKQGQIDADFARVTHYIMEHLNERLTIPQMAEKTNKVPQSFCRWFRKKSGSSFVSYLNKLRVEYACHLLLLENKLPVQEIAFGSGFESLSHFNRTFRKYKDQSPSQYRNWNQNR